MTVFDSKNNEISQTSQRRSKSINKNKESDFNKEMNSVLERKRLIDSIDRFRNKT